MIRVFTERTCYLAEINVICLFSTCHSEFLFPVVYCIFMTKHVFHSLKAEGHYCYILNYYEREKNKEIFFIFFPETKI